MSDVTIAASIRHPGGRPSGYDLNKVAKLCELIGSGMSLDKACRTKGMPHPVTVYRWLARHPEFRVAYNCALMEKFDMMSEELLKIADSPIDDKVDQERMIRMRQGIMAKELPRKYGKMAPIPAPPPVEPRPIEEAKTINAKPSGDPLAEANENFVRALRERRP